MTDTRRPPTEDPALNYVFDSLNRIEEKLDRNIEKGTTDHRNLYIWCTVLSIAFGGGYGLRLMGLI